MDEEFIGTLPQVFEGCLFNSDCMAERISSIVAEDNRYQMVKDISEWIKGKGF
jgi:hypothetical protein